MLSKTLFFFFLFSSFFLKAQDYLWPTSASQYMSSSFCEYRPGHYHAAIDIKTWKQEGFPCYAISDGKILRVRVSPFGYGKVIYLQLDDGNIAVYAHLKSFTAKIDRLLREEQIDRQKYRIDWRPNYWPVKKGEIIGYTGQTGIGVPHLHFEIRDARHQPVNPLYYYKDVVKDSRPPILKSLLAIPQTPGSRIEGSFDIRKIPLVYLRDDTYVLEKPIRAKGLVGLAINGYDMADDVYNKYAFYKTELLVDSIPRFSVIYDTLNYDVTGQIDVETVYSEWVNNRTVYHKLYIDPFNTLPFYNRKLGNGIIPIGKEPVPFRIKVYDYHGNMRQISGMIEPELGYPPLISVLRRDTSQTVVKLDLPIGINQLGFRKSIDGKTWDNIDYYEVIGNRRTNPRQSMFIKLNHPMQTGSSLEASIEMDDGRIHTAKTIFFDSLETSAKIEVFNRGKLLQLKFSDIYDIDGLSLQSGDRFIQPGVDKGKFEYVVSASEIDTPGINLRLQSAHHTMIDTTFYFYRLLPGEKSTTTFLNNEIELTSYQNSIYDTLLVSYQNLGMPDTDFGHPVLSEIHDFSPHDHALKGRMKLSVKYDTSYTRRDRIGIYGINGKNSLSYLGTGMDTVSHTLTANLSRMHKIVVAADTVKPQIEIRHPVMGGKYKNTPKIRFTASDDLSGIEDETAFHVTINDRFVLPEWDPEEKTITAEPHFSLKSGRHLLSIRVTDAAGNVNEEKRTFIIY